MTPAELGKKVTRRLRLYASRFRYEVARREPSWETVAARFGAPGAGPREVLSRALAAMPAGVAEPPPAAAAVAAMRRGVVMDDAGEMDLTEGVDWHRDPVFGVRWPRRFVGALSDRRAGSDVVLLWHRNKMMFMLDVAAAHASAPDDRLAHRCYEAIDSWCRQNPFMVGMNWRSPMETGTRLVVWSLALARLREAPLPEAARCERLLRAVLRQADFLAAGFSHRAIPNNHLVGEAATLFTFAAYWPGLAEAKTWRARAERVLEEEAKRQVLDDGVQFENAINYHLYVLDFYLVYLHAKAAGGEAPPPAITEAVAAMAGVALCLLSPAGRYPQIGDDSITRFFAVREAPGPVFAGGRARLRDLVRGAWADAVGREPWGDELLQTERALAVRHCFDAAGIAVLRDERAHLLLTAGPQHGRPFSAGHLHADAGGVSLETDGRAVLIDSGTWLYGYDGAARDHFRGASAHSLLLADDVEPMTPAAAFRWKTIHRADTVGVDAQGAGRAHCTRTVPGRDGAHFRHRRIVAACGEAWVVADTVAPLETAGAHAAVSYLHTPFAGARARETTVDLGAEADGLVIHAFAGDGLTVELLTAPDPRAAYSLAYGARAFGATVRTSAAVGEGAWLVHVVAPAGLAVACVEDGGALRVSAGATEIAIEIAGARDVIQ